MRIYEDLRGLQRRVAFMQAALVVLMLLLVGQFWNLQVLHGRYYRVQAENNRGRTVRLAAPRGPLLDRQGRVLVENRAAFDIMLTPEHSEDLGLTLARLSRLLNVDEPSIRERIARRPAPFRPVVVKSDATVEDVAAVEARRLEDPETSVDVVPLRSYALNEAAAQLLGRVGEITERQLASGGFPEADAGSIVGQAGVEAQYNRFLMGRDGMRRLIVNSRGIEVGQADQQPAVEGPSLTLTLDMDLQKAMEEAMAPHSGSAVALDPQTGEVLAMTSRPAYDPNQFSGGIEAADWARLATDPATPLMNRVIQGMYSPGSTFKVPMALAALEAGVITPETTFYCPGYLSIYGTLFRCHKEDGHGSLDLVHALALSCNVYFYNVGVRLEIERIARYTKLMGLSAPTGIDLPHEAPGLIPDPQWKLRAVKQPWYAGETVSVAIGQGQVSVTALQMARLAAIVANGGRLVHPHVVKAIGGQPVTVEPPVDLRFKPTTLAAVKTGMMMVVAEGTGRRAALPGITVAGKTGSAQVVTHARLERDKHRFEYQPHGWFMCFAPADNPRVAMAVLIEHGAAGGQSAAPVAGQILARYFGLKPPPETLAASASPLTARPD